MGRAGWELEVEASGTLQNEARGYGCSAPISTLGALHSLWESLAKGEEKTRRLAGESTDILL